LVEFSWHSYIYGLVFWCYIVYFQLPVLHLHIVWCYGVSEKSKL
jgi:hypothetical protein